MSQACAINNRGTVVGLRVASGQPGHAVVWIGGHETDLGVGQAMAVNDLGQVAGSRGPILDKKSRYGTFHACLWTGGKEVDLGVLPGGSYSTAIGMNDRAQVVGDAERTLPKGNRLPLAFLWQGGHIYDLNTLIPNGSGWVLQTACSINNRGQIVGTGLYRGKKRGFLLTPR